MELAMVPDMVKQFVVYLYRHIRERNLQEMYSMYDVSFAKLSDRYYKGTSWPPAEVVSELVEHDHVFLLLYKEMCFRHLYANTQPKLQERCESWENYCNLFRVILHGNVNMQLPNEWLWDMIDEFIYQFQSWCQYRGKPDRMTPEELELIKSCTQVWDVMDVMNYLQALVEKSGIVAELNGDGGRALKESEGYGPHSNVLRMLGYFSLVGLLRMHSLIGDYDSALKALHPITLQNRALLYSPKIPGCHITAHYYTAFCYLMLNRSNDATRILNIALQYVSRIKSYLRQSSQYEQVLKKNEQMYALLAIIVALSPTTQKILDDSTLTVLKEKHAEKMQKMVRGDEATYDELFTYACPKFVTVMMPDFTKVVNTSMEAYRHQLHLFLSEVRKHQLFSTIKQYLKLYTSIPLAKLAALMSTDESTIRTHVIALKQQSRQKEWAGKGDGTEGEWVTSSDIDFYVDIDPATGNEMVVVVDIVPQKRYGEYLARHILRFEEITRELQLMPTGASAAAASYV